jgi:hypothetical protein
MATTENDIIKALYKHLGECKTCAPRGVPLPNQYKCAEGKRLAQVFTIR